jgi:hypothetical protein
MEPRLDAEVASIHQSIYDEAYQRYVDDLSKINRSGDTMFGTLTLATDPTANLEAATKQYVDNLVATGTTSGSRTIAVKNGASSLTKGQPVYISSADGTNIIISAAGNGSEATSSKTIGLVTTALSANAMGVVITNGLLSGLNTSGAGAAGDPVWLGPSGTLVYGLAAKPVAPAHLVYIGIVTKKNASTGEILVNPQNGFELDELHNVLITSPTNGQSLTYETSSGLWKNSTPASSLDSLTDVTITSGTLAGGQVIKYDAGTTQWVNGAAAGGVTASATAPTLATSGAGDAWFDTNDGTLYVCYIDTDSTKQWVQVQANSALEASILSRVGALESQSIAYGNPNPNVIINGGMDIWQRGTTFAPVTNGAYTADRWQAISSVAPSSRTVAQVALAGAISGLEDVSYYLRSTINTIGSGTNPRMRYYVENVATLAGKVVTLSWYGKNSTAASYRTLLSQGFGTGGSTAVTAFDTNVAYTTSWQRLSVTFTMPSIVGKTIGDGNYLLLDFFQAATTGNVMEITGVQLEAGSTATAFRRNAPSIQAELAACQRYYWRSNSPIDNTTLGLGFANTANSVLIQIPLKVTMRITPTQIDYANIYCGDGVNSATNPTSVAFSLASPDLVRILFTKAAAFTQYRPYELNVTGTSGYIGFSAEF